eukprot:747290-Pelagomonas_calceolata.AAC.1
MDLRQSYGLNRECEGQMRCQVSGRTAIVVLTDPDSAKYLKHGPAYMPKSERTYQPFRKLSGANIDSILTSAENEYWKALRRGLAPAFAVNNLK